MANKDLNTNYFMQQQHSRRYNSDLFEFRTKTAAAAGRTFDCGLCSSTMYYILYVLNVYYIYKILYCIVMDGFGLYIPRNLEFYLET